MPPAIDAARDSWQQALDILDHLHLAAHAGWGAGCPDPDELRAWESVGCGGRVLPPAHLIGPLRRFSALGEERIILASALMAHLRKRANAQRLGLSTCKTGALPLSYGPMLT